MTKLRQAKVAQDIRILNKFIQNKSLVDFEHIGNPFTWHNKKKADNSIFARLGRAC